MVNAPTPWLVASVRAAVDELPSVRLEAPARERFPLVEPVALRATLNPAALEITRFVVIGLYPMIASPRFTFVALIEPLACP